ncbi:MAG: DUF881 domain-containing protein [Clostridia bacterium]|nr:DUF881 domain-containing protein [Oscillospiraceae bacterium]MBQ7960201.1 DUF881 domain-containing protein [Clostridia bacterium]
MKWTKKQKFQISMSVMIFILVFAITWQIKGVRKTNAVESQISNRVETLQQDLKNQLEKNEDLLQQIVQLQNDLSKYREQVTESGGATKILKEELNRAETIAGLTDVSGSGIIVTIKDVAKQGNDELSYENGLGIVHDVYILTVINELRAAGAEALSVNGERILATSEVRCAGPTVSINNTKIAAPYEIKAIGNPETLENALRMPGGAIEQSFYYGVEVSVKKSNKLVINKHTGTTNFKYAQIVEPEVTEE